MSRPSNGCGSKIKPLHHHKSPSAKIEYPSKNSWLVDRNRYWKLQPLPSYSSGVLARKELNARTVGNRPAYTSETSASRAMELVLRKNPGLLCYDNCTMKELNTFCQDRGYSNKLKDPKQSRRKAYLVEMLETADEQATFEGFLDLPAELRILVIELHYEDFDMHYSNMFGRWPAQPPVTRACSFLRKEALALFDQTFPFTISYDNAFNLYLRVLPRGVPSEKIRSVRRLQILMGVHLSPRIILCHINLGRDGQPPAASYHCEKPLPELELAVNQVFEQMATRAGGNTFVTSDFGTILDGLAETAYFKSGPRIG